MGDESRTRLTDARLERKVVCRDFPRDYVRSTRYSIFFSADSTDLPRARASVTASSRLFNRHPLIQPRYALQRANIDTVSNPAIDIRGNFIIY